MVPKSLTIDEINRLSSDSFIKIFGNVVEHFPPAAIGILKCRPFHRADNICEAIDNYLDGLTINEKERILQLHPDLAGKFADLGVLTHESAMEQKCAGLDQLCYEDKCKLNKLNEEYRNKFSFPYVSCAREHTAVSILEDIQRRLGNDKDEELLTGIKEVKKISRLRILEIVLH